MKPTARLLHLLVAVTPFLAACDSGLEPSGSARLQVLLTDAPADYLDSALVDIGAVELLGGEERIVLSEDGTDGEVDLLALRDQVTMLLADAEIPAGSYGELRLIVESARVVLAEGYTFDGTDERGAPLKVPSGAQTGIKLKLRAETMTPDDAEAAGDDASGIEISGDMTLVVDFDVNRSFVVQGNPETPAGIKGMLFTPTLRVVVRDIAGSLSGTVTGPEGVAVEGIVVTAESLAPEGSGEEFQSESGTATTDADGAYTIGFLSPGTYRVTLEVPEGFTSDPGSRDVVVGESESVEGVDFALIPG